jgi:hypothetical protein
MHIGLFAERFLGRYGADRVNVILAELLRQRGHQVTLVGARFSPAVLQAFAGHTVPLPEFRPMGAEREALSYLRRTQYFRARHLADFDVCLVGSFPFVTAIPYLRTLADQVIFLDYGVVPTQGYPRALVRLLEQLRANRRAMLPQATHIVAISDFIARSQSEPDSGGLTPVTTVLLAADHLVRGLGCTETSLPADAATGARSRIDQLRRQGRKSILVLGRWEPGCYKSSQAAFEVLRSLHDYEPEAALLVLAPPAQIDAPDDLASCVFGVGLPSDAEMLELMQQVDAGISVSLWEGFNLPVAEMQQLRKPVFAFRLAAHPEVVVSPEQLCRDTDDMADRLAAALRRGGPPSWAEEGQLGRWQKQFCWRRFQDQLVPLIEDAA